MRQPVLNAGQDRSLHFAWTPTVDRFVRWMIEEVARFGGASTSTFFQRDPDGRLFPAISLEPVDPEELRVAKEALRTRSSCLFRRGDLVDGQPISRASAAILLSTPEGELGVVVLRKSGEHFYENEFYLTKSLGASFALILRGSVSLDDDIYLKLENSLMVLLENAHLNQKVREADSRLRAVLEVSNLINSSRQLDQMIETVLYSAVHVIRAESASLFLLDEATGELVFDVITGNETLKGVRIPRGQGIVGICANEKVPIIVNDALTDPRVYRSVEELSRIVTRNLLACPLLIGDECIGVIEVINTVSRADFSPADLEIFSSFSDSVAIALQRRRLLDDIQNANRELERRLRENKCLHRVTATMVEARTVDELFGGVLTVLTNELGLRRASIMLYSPADDRLEIHASVGLPMFGPGEMSAGLARYVLDKKVPFYVSDLDHHPELAVFASSGRYTSGSCILIPMLEGADDTAIGVFSVSDPAQGSFHPDDFRIIVTAVSQIVKGYVNFKLSEQLLQKKAMEKELEITSRIQRDILPSVVPDHDFIALSARSVPARTMGGDFYDYYRESPEGRFTVLVADVSGKSLPAALFMAVSSSILRTMTRTEDDPARILARSNDLLFEESESGMFVTVFLAQFDPVRGVLRYASAGHNEMLLLHSDGRFEVLRGKGPPLGVVPTRPGLYEGRETPLCDGDMLILFTDGVVEAVNRDNEEFGLDRFVDILRDLRERSLGEIIDSVYRASTEFAGNVPQYDDFTMLATRYTNVLNQEYRFVFPAVPESVPALVDEVARVLSRSGVSGPDLDDILLACDEVSTNIVSYSFHGLPVAEPRFQCLYERHGRLLRFTFIDGGRKFDFQSAGKPALEENLSGVRRGGFGIFLVRTLMDRTEYEHRDGMNYLSIEKKLG